VPPAARNLHIVIPSPPEQSVHDTIGRMLYPRRPSRVRAAADASRYEDPSGTVRSLRLLILLRQRRTLCPSWWASLAHHSCADSARCASVLWRPLSVDDPGAEEAGAPE
jgi:hypothetical protein